MLSRFPPFSGSMCGKKTSCDVGEWWLVLCVGQKITMHWKKNCVTGRFSGPRFDREDGSRIYLRNVAHPHDVTVRNGNNIKKTS
jgi:hypothetical protein